MKWCVYVASALVVIPAVAVAQQRYLPPPPAANNYQYQSPVPFQQQRVYQQPAYQQPVRQAQPVYQQPHYTVPQAQYRQQPYAGERNPQDQIYTSEAYNIKAQPFEPKWYGALRGELATIDDWTINDSRPGGITATGDVSFDMGFGMGGAIGYQLSEFFRVEADLGVRVYGADSLEVTVTDGVNTVTETLDEDEYGLDLFNIMMNAYIDLPVSEKWIPYVGGGIGWSFQTNGATEDSLAYQGMTGLQYKYDRGSMFYAGYRYFAIDGFGFSVSEFSPTSHVFEMGVRGFF